MKRSLAYASAVKLKSTLLPAATSSGHHSGNASSMRAKSRRNGKAVEPRERRQQLRADGAVDLLMGFVSTARGNWRGERAVAPDRQTRRRSAIRPNIHWGVSEEADLPGPLKRYGEPAGQSLPAPGLASRQ